MNATRRSLEQWRDYVGGCLDFRPEEGIFRIARDMFTEPELFDLEMELIFEKNWIYACHESELARPHDFVTLRAGRQPLIVTRDGNGQLHALVNACQHRGATLVRVGKGNQSTFTCPFHAWCYKNDGRLVKVKAPGEYPEGFDKATRGLKKARIQSYRGFVFVSLDVAGEDDLVDFLGDARVFLDMLVAQSPSGELEVGHSVLFSEMPNPAVRPGYASVMPRLVAEYGQARAEWMMHRLRNLNLYPSLFVIDQISSQLRIVRPLAWNRTEIVSQCIGVKGESDADRENRIRQFEDFFNVSGMGTPDDLVEFREAQRGFQARLERWSDISRGHGKWLEGATPNSQALGIAPLLTGTEITHEGLYVNQHAHWRRFLLDGLERLALRAKEVTP